MRACDRRETQTYKTGQHQEPIELIAYQDKHLCLVGAIKQYISVTDPLRDKSECKLLISFRKPHRAVRKDTVARWVKSTLANAEIDVTSFATHSTRAASTSYSVNKAGLSLAQVHVAAGWANGPMVLHLQHFITSCLRMTTMVMSS